MAHIPQAADDPTAPRDGGAPSSTASTGRAERLVSLDLVRGVAVLGILFANITAFAHPSIAYFWPDALPDGGTRTDHAIWLFQFLFVDGKMRGLFTLLFGAGMMLFLERVRARGGMAWLQFRRLAWLLIFGLLHFLLLFHGDILVAYAVWGMVALFFARLAPVNQLILGLMFYALGSAMMIEATGVGAYYEQVPGACAKAHSPPCMAVSETLDAALADAADEREIYGGESYAAVLGHALNDRRDDLARGVLYGGYETFPLILIGMALYGFGLFSGGIDRAALRKWGWRGVIAGTALTMPLGLWALHAKFPYLLTLFLFTGAAQAPRLPVVLGLAALLVAWTPALAPRPIGRRLIAAGRAAFSNYIGTSAVMMLVFQGWALGLHGTLSRAELLPVVLAGCVLMLAWSKPWLDRFRFGPLEWLWRCLTYGRLLPLRR